MDAISLNLTAKVEPAKETARSSASSSSRAEAAGRLAAAADLFSNAPGDAVRQAAIELSLRLGLTVELGRDERTGRNVVRIYNQEGDRLLRQIPAEAVLRILDRLMSGSEEGILGLQV